MRGMALPILLAMTCRLAQATSPEAMAWLDHEIPPGTQSLAMGSALAPLAEDWSAAWHNPAALAWRRRMEFNGGLDSRIRHEERSVSSDGERASTRLSSSGLSHVGYVHPLPALRGGFCWALGWTRQAQVDASGRFPDGGWRVSEDGSGSEDMWLLSLAGQWTADLAGGMSLALHHQELERLDREENTLSGEKWLAHHRATLEGLGARFSLAHRKGPLRLSLLVEPAYTLTVDYRQTSSWSHPDSLPQTGREHSGYDLKRPLLFDLGVGWHRPGWQLAMAWDWQDWSALRYEDLPNGEDLVLNQDALARAFTPRQRLRLGVEWVLPAWELRLRGGLRYSRGGFSGSTIADESTADLSSWAYREDPRLALSGGLAYLMEERVALEFSTERESWTRHWLDWATTTQRSEVRQTVKRWQLRMGVLYRF